MPPAPLVIRPATEPDLPGLLSVRADEHVHHERLACQQDGRWVYLVAADAPPPAVPQSGGVGRAIYGFAVLIWDGDEHHVHYPILADLRVRAAYRGRGVGTRLMERAEWLCRERGLPRIGLSVNPTDNPRAHALYRRQGYHATGQAPHCDIYAVSDEHGHTHLYEDWCICLVKDLTQPG